MGNTRSSWFVMITIFFSLIAIAAYAKARMDLLAHGKISSYDPDQEWRKKWKDGDPRRGEKFPGSSTVFVALTDRWHLMQFVFLNSIFLSMVPFIVWWKVLIARVIFGLIFEINYRIGAK
jgi:hypothetical protein